MTDPIRPEARRLFASTLESTDRVLVTGAGGWFGMTLAAMLESVAVPTMLLTRTPRVVDYGFGRFEAVGWDIDAIRAFSPSIVIDCAFVLRDYIDDVSLERFVLENSRLTARLLQLAQLTGVRGVVSVSSGAAVFPVDATFADLDVNPYGYQKRAAELALLGLEVPDRSIVIARPWSLSGTLAPRPQRYAFSNLILQARAGSITIQAAHEVLRRYVGVDDFFAVVLGLLGSGGGILNSGGELVELSTLADRIDGVLGLSTPVHRSADFPAGEPDAYYSTDDSWSSACDRLGFTPADLDEQIVAVDRALGNA